MEWDAEAAKWVTYVPTLNGISTFGGTQSEALKHTRAMILAYVEAMAEDRLPLPFSTTELQSLLRALKQS